MPKEHDIVFEDLHGEPDEQSAVVDLDADTKDLGITRFNDDESGEQDFEIDLDGTGQDDDAADDASASGQDDDSGSSDSEDDEYSKRVQQRIKRATRAEKKAKADADYWKEQAQQANQSLATLQKESAEGTIERVNSDIESVERRMEQAHEAGETKEVVKLTSQLTDLKAERFKAEATLAEVDSPETGNDSPETGNIPPKQGRRSELVDEWMSGNDDWYGARGFERQTRVANRIDKEVFDDGFDPGTEEYYEELNSRIKAKMPELFDDDTGSDDADETPSRRSRRQPVAPVGRSESASTKKRSSSSRVQLNETDFANMRRFGLDTNDPEVLKEYARNKREADSSAQRR